MKLTIVGATPRDKPHFFLFMRQWHCSSGGIAFYVGDTPSEAFDNFRRKAACG